MFEFFAAEPWTVATTELIYRAGEYSFACVPSPTKIDFTVLLNDVQLSVVDERLVALWGLCPLHVARATPAGPPAGPRRTLGCRTSLTEPWGQTYRLDRRRLWRGPDGWICLGEHAVVESAETLEVLPGVRAVLKGHALHALWLQPTLR